MTFPQTLDAVFITGTQRSGTTLVHHILNGSAQIWSKNEMWEIHDMLFGARDVSPEAFQLELCRHLKKDFDPSIFANQEQPNLNNLCTTLGRCADAAGKSRWALKDPRITYFLPQYADAFPAAKFILIIRDPRAVCNSYLNSGGYRVGRPANAYAGARRWRNEVRLQRDFAHQNSGRAQIIRYEDLIQNFRPTVSMVADFLSIPISKELLEYYRDENAIAVHAGNENILRAPDPSIIDKWQGEFSAQQLRVIESVAGEEMDEFGYERKTKAITISPLFRFLYSAHNALTTEARWKAYRLRQVLGAAK